MKKTLPFLALFLVIVNLTAQDIDEFRWFGRDYEDQLFLSLGANRVSVSNNKAYNPDAHELSGVTLKLDMKNMVFEKGAASFSYESKLLGDIIWLGAKIFDDQSEIYADEESAITSGFIGWYTRLWNVTEPNSFQLTAGFNMKDFNFVVSEARDKSRPFSNPTNMIIEEPAGNYYTVGPSIGARYNLFNVILIDYHSDLSIPFGKLDPSARNYEEDKSVKNPYFINHVIEFTTSKGLFVGYEYLSIINRANVNSKPVRNELFVGFRIPV